MSKLIKRFVFVLLTTFLTLGFISQVDASPNESRKVPVNKQIEFRETFGLNTSNEKLKEVSNFLSDNEYGVPLTQSELDELRDRDNFAERYAPILIKELRRDNLNSEHATFYRDNKNGGKLVDSLVKGNSKNQEIINSIKSRIPDHAFERIKFLTVNYSEEDLDQVVNKISEDQQLLKDNDIPFTFASANLQENNVQVGIYPYSDKAANFLENRYGRELIEVIEKEEVTGESRTQNYFYMYGGIQIAGTETNSTGTSGYCSNGFSLNDYRGFFIVTAGHCTRNWTSMYQGGYYKGSVYLTQEGGYADVGVIKLDSDRTTNAIYRYSYGDRNMTSYQGVNSDYVGQSVAKTGVTTGVTSGEITSRNWSGNVTTGGKTFYYQYLRDTSYESAGGDSGGTVYWGNELRGSHTASGGKFSHVHYIIAKVPGIPKTN